MRPNTHLAKVVRISGSRQCDIWQTLRCWPKTLDGFERSDGDHVALYNREAEIIKADNSQMGLKFWV